MQAPPDHRFLSETDRKQPGDRSGGRRSHRRCLSQKRTDRRRIARSNRAYGRLAILTNYPSLRDDPPQGGIVIIILSADCALRESATALEEPALRRMPTGSLRQPRCPRNQRASPVPVSCVRPFHSPPCPIQYCTAECTVAPA